MGTCLQELSLTTPCTGYLSPTLLSAPTKCGAPEPTFPHWSTQWPLILMPKCTNWWGDNCQRGLWEKLLKESPYWPGVSLWPSVKARPQAQPKWG